MVRSRPKMLSRTPPIEFPSSRITSTSSESFRPHAPGPVAERNEGVGHRLDEARRAADEDPRLLLRRERNVAQQVDVDAPRVSRPARRGLARERVDDLEAAAA